MTNNEWIDRNRKYTLIDGDSGFSIGFAGMDFTTTDLDRMTNKFNRAYHEMAKIEVGDIKNPDEQRQVTHFTDRQNYASGKFFARVENFATAIRQGQIVGSSGKKFTAAIINGIGGSALGPQLVQFALNGPYWNEKNEEARRGNLKIYFLDNTDSAGFADVMAVVEPETTLVVTVSKSGGTLETRNNMIACEKFYAARNIDFSRHAVAVTMRDSGLWTHAASSGWLELFDMPESIGGRTSETSIVGHVPAALAGIDFQQLLAGACHMDTWTRCQDYLNNPAYMLAAMWYIAGNGKGDRNMVIVPYSDRLILLSRYLQQLIMESLGKERDLDGQLVHQGLNVFGNKGGTDAHAYIQQLNDGRDDFFITFVEVLKDAMIVPLDDKTSMGTYLHGFQEGLATALRLKSRQFINIKIEAGDAFNLGMLIALYERAVAVYAEFININAFHQPGVQAYKLAANVILRLREQLMQELMELGEFSGTAAELVGKLELTENEVEIAGLLDKAALSCPDNIISRCYNEKSGWIYTIHN